MSKLITNTPIVMSMTGNDPCGGTGIAADIETLTSLGCHCTPVITNLCARDTNHKIDNQSIDTILFIEQTRAVLEDVKVDLFNIGDIATIANAEAMHTILRDYGHVPVVLHPDLPEQEENQGLARAISTLLLPHALITILSKQKALALSPNADSLSACAQELMDSGCKNILITDTEPTGPQICNHWFSSTNGSSQQYQWERLPQSFLGARSTLSAALSAYLAHGLSLSESIQQAQQFTWQALKHGHRIGMGKLIPNRTHWCKK